MLKAMRYALFRESSRSGGPLIGTNLTALHGFVSLLADHFPVTTTYGNSEAAGNPFAINSDWDHCRGSSGQFRGSLGLWFGPTSALTVSGLAKQAESTPLEPLQAIRAWVTSFFGCLHCRDHFHKMTTSSFPIEAQVHKPEDVFLYLWKAHNIVNARLQGRDTEDPQFPKVQFPGSFLCPNCTTNGSFNEKQTKDFLISYYSQVKPYQSPRFLLR
ncbi:hypothetical protein COOONC_22454 [Cooperia oncophora]